MSFLSIFVHFACAHLSSESKSRAPELSFESLRKSPRQSAGQSPKQKLQRESNKEALHQSHAKLSAKPPQSPRRASPESTSIDTTPKDQRRLVRMKAFRSPRSNGKTQFLKIFEEQ